MNYFSTNELKTKIEDTGFLWEKSIKVVENLVESVKMNLCRINKKRKISEDQELTRFSNLKKNNFCKENTQSKLSNSGILIIPSEIKESYLQENKTITYNKVSDQFVTFSCNKSDFKSDYENDLFIFDGIQLNDSNKSDVPYNATPAPSILECGKISGNILKTQKSLGTITSSSMTFLNENMVFKKRKLIVPPIVNGKRFVNLTKIKEFDQESTIRNSRRKLRLIGENYVKEYCILKDEEYGIIDNTDQILLDSDNVHRQDDDRQTTTEIQEWAIGLVKRYLGETSKLINEEKSSQLNIKSNRIRSFRQRFGFSTKVR